jgi:hypothetical protein
MNPILEGDIEFEIHFGPLFPYKSPSVFCKTAVKQRAKLVQYSSYSRWKRSDRGYNRSILDTVF